MGLIRWGHLSPVIVLRLRLRSSPTVSPDSINEFPRTQKFNSLANITAGQRFSVDEAQKYVEWMDFSFYSASIYIALKFADSRLTPPPSHFHTGYRACVPPFLQIHVFIPDLAHDRSASIRHQVPGRAHHLRVGTPGGHRSLVSFSLPPQLTFRTLFAAPGTIPCRAELATWTPSTVLYAASAFREAQAH